MIRDRAKESRWGNLPRTSTQGHILDGGQIFNEDQGASPLRASISELIAIAEREVCDIPQLSNQCSDVAKAFQDVENAPLALIAETVAENLRHDILDLATARFATIDLCQRLIEAFDSDENFSFDGLEPGLEELVFYEPPPRFAGGGDEGQSTDSDATPGPAASGASVDGDTNSGADASATDQEEELVECTDPDILKEFLQEAREHLETSEQLLLKLESDEKSNEAIHGLFRAVHSVKGSAGFLGLNAVGELSHLGESVLVLIRDGMLGIRGPIFDLILTSVDFLKVQIEAIRTCLEEAKPLRSPRAPRILLVGLQQIIDTGTVQPETVSQINEATQVKTAEPDPDVAKKQGASSESMRVDGRRLEELIDLIGELVITESGVQHELQKRSDLNASSLASRLRKVVREVQQLSLSLKMVPVGTVLQKMNRIVRDLSGKLDKPCRLQIEGGDTEVDKSLLECIADPLVHLIRNSLDHGIEPDRADRVAAGKPEQATITLSAEHRGGNILIHIRDDGRGLDRDRILSRAMERGVVSKDANLTPHEIDQLIFEPGFSTAEVVSEVSGRGVGMDVVRKNIEGMRGTITVHSETGKGAEVILELPLTLSIIDGTVVRVAERHFIIPTLSVIEQIQATGLDFSKSDVGTLLQFRGHFIPSYHLGDVVGSAHGAEPPNGRVCMIVEAGQRLLAVIVDEVVGQQPVVIKPLGGILDAFDLFAGGALLADGEIAFVLDLNSLYRSTPSLETSKTATMGALS